MKVVLTSQAGAHYSNINHPVSSPLLDTPAAGVVVVVVVVVVGWKVVVTFSVVVAAYEETGKVVVEGTRQ